MFLLEFTLIYRFGNRSPLLQRSVHPRAIASSASIVQLKEKIRVAIDEEDYEAAATFRDELRFEFHPSYGIREQILVWTFRPHHSDFTACSIAIKLCSSDHELWHSFCSSCNAFTLSNGFVNDYRCRFGRNCMQDQTGECIQCGRGSQQDVLCRLPDR